MSPSGSEGAAPGGPETNPDAPVLLDGRRLRLFRDPDGRLHMENGIGERFGPLQVLRTLPLTRPSEWIVLREEDDREVGVIASMDELKTADRALLEEELQRLYLRARVTAIHRAEARFGIITWDLETEFGRKTVYVRDRQNIRPLADGRVMLIDIHDGRYEIPPLDELDEASRHWLEIEM